MEHAGVLARAEDMTGSLRPFRVINVVPAHSQAAVAREDGFKRAPFRDHDVFFFLISFYCAPPSTSQF